MIRSTFCVVGMSIYTASKSGWGSRILVIDSITVRGLIDEYSHLTNSNVRVTFSSSISNCLSTALRSFWEWSSTTRIFHRPGGLTDRIASKNSAKLSFQQVPHQNLINGSLLLRTRVINDDILTIRGSRRYYGEGINIKVVVWSRVRVRDGLLRLCYIWHSVLHNRQGLGDGYIRHRSFYLISEYFPLPAIYLQIVHAMSGSYGLQHKSNITRTRYIAYPSCVLRQKLRKRTANQ